MRLNLVQGQSAGGLLRQACRQFGVPGEVEVIDDDLSIGPLRNDELRNKWWTEISGSWLATSVHEQWARLSESIHQRGVDQIVVWTSDSGRDQVFGQMAASKVQDFAGEIAEICVPSVGGLAGVGLFRPETLATFESMRRFCDANARNALSFSFHRYLSDSDGVRYLTGGAVQVRPYPSFDQFLLDRCPANWTKWRGVVGNATTDCDGRNPLSDVFFSWRLRILVERGRVESQGEIRETGDPMADVLIRSVT